MKRCEISLLTFILHNVLVVWSRMIAGTKPYTFNAKGNKNLPSEEGAGAEVGIWG